MVSEPSTRKSRALPPPSRIAFVVLVTVTLRALPMVIVLAKATSATTTMSGAPSLIAFRNSVKVPTWVPRSVGAVVAVGASVGAILGAGVGAIVAVGASVGLIVGAGVGAIVAVGVIVAVPPPPHAQHMSPAVKSESSCCSQRFVRISNHSQFRPPLLVAAPAVLTQPIVGAGVGAIVAVGVVVAVSPPPHAQHISSELKSLAS